MIVLDFHVKEFNNWFGLSSTEWHAYGPIICYVSYSVNPFQNYSRLYKPWGRSFFFFKKTLWEKVKMLVTSIFTFYHNVFCSSKMYIHWVVFRFLPSQKGILSSQEYFSFSLLQKHVRKESCVSTCVRKPGNTSVSSSAMIWLSC